MFCNKTNDIQVIENDLKKRSITLMDRFGNKCQLEYNEDDTIIALTRTDANDPIYMLYLLVTLTNALFLSEDNLKNCIQVPLKDKPDNKIVEITHDTYKEFTKYFEEYVKYRRNFEKEYQLLNVKKQTYSDRINTESNFLDTEKNDVLKTKMIGAEKRETGEYFELDLDFEIDKITIKNQDVNSQNNIN